MSALVLMYSASYPWVQERCK